MVRMMTDQHRRLSSCVCNTLRMVTRVVTQLYDDCLRPRGLRVTEFSILAAIARLGEASLKQLEDDLAIDQTTLTRSLSLLERDGVIERASHPDGRVKAMRLTAKGRRALEVARPMWAQAQGKVLRALGTKAWADAQGRSVAHAMSSCQHHSAEGAVFDQMAESFGGVLQLVRSFDDRLDPSRSQ